MQVASVHHEYGRLTLATAGLLLSDVPLMENLTVKSCSVIKMML